MTEEARLQKQREYNAEWRAANREKVRAISARWRAANRELARQRVIDFLAKNPGKDREYSAAYRRRNPGKRRATCAAYRAANVENEKASRREWASKNKDRLAAKAARRRATKLKATPAWADYIAIAEIYAEARRLTVQTGVEHHVDHIYPLKSPIMCGLHVEANLQILIGIENLSKGNRPPLTRGDSARYFRRAVITESGVGTARRAPRGRL